MEKGQTQQLTLSFTLALNLGVSALKGKKGGIAPAVLIIVHNVLTFKARGKGCKKCMLRVKEV